MLPCLQQEGGTVCSITLKTTPLSLPSRTVPVFIRSTYDLYMTHELVRNEYNEVRGFYRLHAKNPHTLDMALTYDIECPKCGNLLKQVGHCLNDHELGMYVCPVCDKKKGGF